MDPRYPFKEVCQQWLSLIRKAEEQRDEQFGKFARETRKFFDSDHNWMWDDEYAYSRGGYLQKDGAVRMPQFRVTINKISDAVDLYGPALMHRYPKIDVSPEYWPDIEPASLQLDPQDPQDAAVLQQVYQQRQDSDEHKDTVARIAARYLNWLQVEEKKKYTSRLAITDAIVSGLGLFYHELHWPRGGNTKYPRSRVIKWEQYVKDPDAECNEDVQWIAVKWTVPVNVFERKFGLAPGSVLGSKQSSQSAVDRKSRNDMRNNKKRSDSWDLVTYWEVFSKNGFGARLKSMKQLDPDVKRLVESWGDFCYVVVTEDLPYPANITPEMIESGDEDLLFEQAHWPIPFYLDSGAGQDWPVSELYFKENPASKWPISIFKPLIGEIRFVNWCMSFLADKVAQSATEYIGVLKEAATEIQDQLINQKGPFAILQLDSKFGRRIDELVSFLGKPQFSSELWRVVSEVMDIIEKGSGVTELLYGQTSRQMRSATEASALAGNASIRPDDMAAKTDDWYSLSAMKEWQAAVWLLDGEDVLGPLGPAGAHVFETRIVTEEFSAVAADYNYRLVAGSARKPNKGQRLESLLRFSQVAMPMWQQLMQMGMPGPYNAFIEETARALEIDDHMKFHVTTEELQQFFQQQQQQQQQQEEEEAARRQEEFEREQARKDADKMSDVAWRNKQEQIKTAGAAAQLKAKMLEGLLEKVLSGESVAA